MLGTIALNVPDGKNDNCENIQFCSRVADHNMNLSMKEVCFAQIRSLQYDSNTVDLGHGPELPYVHPPPHNLPTPTFV